ADSGRGPTRSVGATVILVDGALAAYLARGDRQLVPYLPDSEPARSKSARAIARALADRPSAGMLIEEIDGTASSLHPLASYLTEAGFVSGAMGMQRVVSRQSAVTVVSRSDRRGPSRRISRGGGSGRRGPRCRLRSRDGTSTTRLTTH